MHLVAGIELKILRFYLPCYVCVCPKTRQAHCATITHLKSLLAFTQGVCPKTRQVHCFRFSVRVFAFTQCVCPKLRQSLSYHCFAQLRYWFFHLRGSAISLLTCFLITFHFQLHSVSVRRRGRCAVCSTKVQFLVHFCGSALSI